MSSHNSFLLKLYTVPIARLAWTHYSALTNSICVVTGRLMKLEASRAAIRHPPTDHRCNFTSTRGQAATICRASQEILPLVLPLLVLVSKLRSTLNYIQGRKHVCKSLISSFPALHQNLNRAPTRYRMGTVTKQGANYKYGNSLFGVKDFIESCRRRAISHPS